jgi:hypothetical protein
MTQLTKIDAICNKVDLSDIIVYWNEELGTTVKNKTKIGFPLWLLANKYFTSDNAPFSFNLIEFYFNNTTDFSEELEHYIRLNTNAGYFAEKRFVEIAQYSFLLFTKVKRNPKSITIILEHFYKFLSNCFNQYNIDNWTKQQIVSRYIDIVQLIVNDPELNIAEYKSSYKHILRGTKTPSSQFASLRFVWELLWQQLKNIDFQNILKQILFQAELDPTSQINTKDFRVENFVCKILPNLPPTRIPDIIQYKEYNGDGNPWLCEYIDTIIINLYEGLSAGMLAANKIKQCN